jgi:HD-like signal output (HDOD) protein
MKKQLDQIVKRLLSPGATLDELYELIRTDRSLTQRILQLANSAYYAVPGGVSDLRKALNYVGATTIVQLVLTSATVKQ